MKKNKNKTLDMYLSETLADPQHALRYLRAVLRDVENGVRPEFFLQALSDVAKAQGLRLRNTKENSFMRFYETIGKLGFKIELEKKALR